MFRFLHLLCLSLIVCSTPWAAEADVDESRGMQVRYTALADNDDPRSEYIIKLLDLILDATTDEFGAYQLLSADPVRSSPHLAMPFHMICVHHCET